VRFLDFMMKRADDEAARWVQFAYAIATAFVVWDIFETPGVWTALWLLGSMLITGAIVGRSLSVERRRRRQYSPLPRVSIWIGWRQASWWFMHLEMWSFLAMVIFVFAVVTSSFVRVA
jgi:hypothetical protein